MAKRAEWVKRVAALQQSGLTVREYAAQIDVNEPALMNWRWRLRRESAVGARGGKKKPGPAPQLNFVEVLATESAGAVAEREKTEPFEVCLRGEVRVRVPMHFSVASLRDLFAALGVS